MCEEEGKGEKAKLGIGKNPSLQNLEGVLEPGREVVWEIDGAGRICIKERREKEGKSLAWGLMGVAVPMLRRAPGVASCPTLCRGGVIAQSAWERLSGPRFVAPSSPLAPGSAKPVFRQPP